MRPIGNLSRYTGGPLRRRGEWRCFISVLAGEFKDSSLQLYQTAGSCPSCQPRMNVPFHSWSTLELFFGRRPRNCAALPVGLLRFLVALALD
jgi:hypothetical protein